MIYNQHSVHRKKVKERFKNRLWGEKSNDQSEVQEEIRYLMYVYGLSVWFITVSPDMFPVIKDPEETLCSSFIVSTVRGRCRSAEDLQSTCLLNQSLNHFLLVFQVQCLIRFQFSIIWLFLKVLGLSWSYLVMSLFVFSFSFLYPSKIYKSQMITTVHKTSKVITESQREIRTSGFCW